MLIHKYQKHNQNFNMSLHQEHRMTSATKRQSLHIFRLWPCTFVSTYSNTQVSKEVDWLSSLQNTRGLPITLLAKEARFRVARPRSPILTDPVGPVMKMLSHFKSLWMMGGVRVCRNCKPFSIWRHQLRSTLIFITLNLFKYLKKE